MGPKTILALVLVAVLAVPAGAWELEQHYGFERQYTSQTTERGSEARREAKRQRLERERKKKRQNVKEARQRKRHVARHLGDFPNAHPLVRRIWANVKVDFPDAGNYGVWSCRAVRGGSSWSQHAYGRAIDVAPTSMAQGDAIARYVRERWPGRTYVIWRAPGHWDHLHIEVVPRAAGTPRC